MGPARVSSPHVDLTRCGLDKTPNLLALQSRIAPLPYEGEESSGEEDLEEEEEEEFFNH